MPFREVKTLERTRSNLKLINQTFLLFLVVYSFEYVFKHIVPFNLDQLTQKHTLAASVVLFISCRGKN